MKKKVKGKVGIFHLDRRPMYYGCSGTIMAALQHANTALSDPLAYYASLMSWSFFFDSDKRIPLGIPADELMHRNLLSLYGISRSMTRRNCFEDLWLAIEDLIAQNRMAIAWVDANGVNDAAFHYDKISGEVELMAIHGYDREADQLYITVNPQRFHGAIPLSCLPAILPDNVIYDYQVPANAVAWPSSRAWGLLRGDVEKILNKQTFGSIETGLPAMALFAEEMAIRIDQEDESIYAWLEESRVQLAFIGPQRIALAQTLGLVAAREENKTVGDWAQTFYGFGQSWEVIRNMFFKACKRENASLLQRISKRINSLIAGEHQQALILQEILGSPVPML